MNLDELKLLLVNKIAPQDLDLGGVWYSAFQPNSDIHPDWHRERMRITARGSGEFVCSTIPGKAPPRFDWVAAGTISNREVIAGTWASKMRGRQTAGSFILSVDHGGKKLLGFLLGKSDNAPKEVNYGAWVLVRHEPGRRGKAVEEELVKAREELGRLCPGFHAFLPPQWGRKTSAKVQRLLDENRLTESQRNLLREAARCLGCGAFRAAIVTGWGFAYDCLVEWMWNDDDRRRQFLDHLPSAVDEAKLTSGEAIGEYLMEKQFLRAMTDAGLLTKISEKLEYSLKERNSYAHANKLAPTESQATHYVENLIDLVTSYRFAPVARR